MYDNDQTSSLSIAIARFARRDSSIALLSAIAASSPLSRKSFCSAMASLMGEFSLLTVSIALCPWADSTLLTTGDSKWKSSDRMRNHSP